MSRISSGLVTHAGIALLIVGALGSWLAARSGESRLQVGASAPIDGTTVRVEKTWREDHANGQPKQWHTMLSVIENGKVIRSDDVSVNNPLSYRGLDIYQAGWGPHAVKIAFNGQEQTVALQPMGSNNVGMVSIAPDVALVLAIRKQDSPLSVYVKTAATDKPQPIAELTEGDQLKLGSVVMQYQNFLPTTILKYKRDPALPLVYFAFALITIGSCMTIIPKKGAPEKQLV